MNRREFEQGVGGSLGGGRGCIRTRRGWLSFAAAGLLLCSCASSSQSVPEPERLIRAGPSEASGALPADDAVVPPEMVLPDGDGLLGEGDSWTGELEEPAGGEEAYPEESPAALLPPEMDREEEEDMGLFEPPIDLAEAAGEPQAPPEESPDSALPEPPAPYFPEPPVEAPAVTGGAPDYLPPVPPEDPAVPPPPAVPSAPVEPAAPLPVIPPAVPPPFIRPAEEDIPPPSREAPSRPDLPALPAGVPPVETRERGITFSRVVRATVGQLVEVPFRGTGWVYLGEMGSRPGIGYSSRRLDPEGQSFVFRVEAPGTYGLKFYKQDFIRDYILNDYVQVIAGEPPEAAVTGWFNPSIDRGRVVAEPRWPSALEEAEALGRNTGAGAIPGDGGAGSAGPAAAAQRGIGPADPGAGPVEPAGGTGGAAAGPVAPGGLGERPAGPGAGSPDRGAVRSLVSDDGVVPVQPAATAGAPQDAPAAAASGLSEGVPARDDPLPGGYLDRARREFEAGRVAAALTILDQFRERYPSGSDEAWWLYGQFYEASGPSRDVRAALDYYRRLVREYPQSSRYNDARRRIAYLERYYINIR